MIEISVNGVSGEFCGLQVFSSYEIPWRSFTATPRLKESNKQLQLIWSKSGNKEANLQQAQMEKDFFISAYFSLSQLHNREHAVVCVFQISPFYRHFLRQTTTIKCPEVIDVTLGECLGVSTVTVPCNKKPCAAQVLWL